MSSNHRHSSDLSSSTENSPLLLNNINRTGDQTHNDSTTPVRQTESNNILDCRGSGSNRIGQSCLFISGVAVGLGIIGLVLLSQSQGLRTEGILSQESPNEANKDPLVVETPLGKVKAQVLKSREGREYYAFYKIPYAKPPLDNLRFKVPEPAEKWEGTRDENQVAPQCIQKAKYSKIVEAVGEEDCLYLNIYTPKIPNANGPNAFLMPTLFYVHGGGFTDGNGSRYGGKYFMDEDAVLITFQYRLGPFGFLSTEDGEISGNMGFKDMVMGLKWVQENVKYFGGDPNRVMIFGNSAGAFSVSHLMISPMANGLFHSAISQSGGSFCPGLFPSGITAQKTLEALAEEVGCSIKSQRRLIRCLRKMDARDLAIARTENITYNLIVEQYETDDSSNVFMPDTPYNMVESGRVNRVPWTVGVNSAEFVHTALGYLKDIELIDSLNKNFTSSAQELLQINSIRSGSISQSSKDFYFGDKKIGNETARNLSNLVSDRAMVHCSKVQGLMQAEFSDTYLYYLSKLADKSYADAAKVGFPPGDYGVAHADELQFLFNYSGYPEYPVNSSSYQFSRLLVTIWTQFAATGKHSSLEADWETVKPGQRPISWFELNDNPKPTTVLQSRMEFWDQFTHKDLNYA